MKYIMKYLAPFCLILMWSIMASAQASGGFPLVIVVHGIGGGNMDPGWSRPYADAWNVEVHEVTFRYKGRTAINSYTDFVPEAGDWALSVQNQIKEIVRQNPGRRIIIVAHSWGTVVTKMALDGGAGDGRSEELGLQGYKIDGDVLRDIVVEELVTLAPPLGPNGNPEVAGNLINHRLDVPAGKPRNVKHWTSFCDLNDLVSSKSHNLPGAENVELNSGKSSISAHTGIWTDPTVRKHIWNEAVRISNMPRLTSGAAAVPTAGTVRFIAWDNTNGQPLANAQVIVYGAINSPSEKFRESGTTNAAGTVDIPGIVLGAYTITASHASCPRFESGLTNLKPGEMHRLVILCEQTNPPTDRRRTEPGPTSGGSSEGQIVAEYQSLLPVVLEKNKKPWHTRINLIANAVKQGTGYRVNYQTYCLIEQGPDKGKDYMCFEFDTVLDLGALKSAVADMKRQLGR